MNVQETHDELASLLRELAFGDARGQHKGEPNASVQSDNTARPVAVAFSGGVDSTLLLEVAHQALGDDAFAITVHTSFSPQEDFDKAVSFCEERGIAQQVIEVDVLSDGGIIANTSERCYLCKHMIFEAIMAAVEERGAIIVDGTNADDAADFRPGERALRELGIVSPLKEAGFSKPMIRELSRVLDLPTSEDAANACLATRIPTGVPLDLESLTMIDAAERFLHSLGFAGCRVRLHDEVARIEVDPADIEKLVQGSARTHIIRRFTEIGFRYIALDLAGYRMGNMN